VVGSRHAAQLLDSLAPVLGVNRMTQAAVQYTLERGERELTKRRATVLAERGRLEEGLTALPFEAPQSQAHFVWLRAEGMSGGQLVAALERAGVIAFPGSVLGDDEHVRITLCSTAATDRLLSVLPGIATFCAEPGADVIVSEEVA
jgi:histidinol-phosphate/aromatic aminotransferase/cobyric acid decarboxylase-like protein